MVRMGDAGRIPAKVLTFSVKPPIDRLEVRLGQDQAQIWHSLFCLGLKFLRNEGECFDVAGSHDVEVSAIQSR
jgi:hypothetical protein